jgi:hypothetical protein
MRVGKKQEIHIDIEKLKILLDFVDFYAMIGSLKIKIGVNK